MTADRFRHAYAETRTAGYNGTRAEFAALVTSCPTLFRGGVVAGARDWLRSRGQSPGALPMARSAERTLVALPS